MYNKQVWKDEIPDLARPILDGSGKQKTDPQTGRPLFELVQEGTRITSARLNTMEGGIEAAHTLVEQLARELGGNFVAVIDGVMGLKCNAQGLTATWTAGTTYVGGRRYEVSAGSMPLNPTQGQYLYVDIDGIVKKTTSQVTAKRGVLLFYVATDTSGVISSTDQRVSISIEEIMKKLDTAVTDAALDATAKADAARVSAKTYTDDQVKGIADRLDTEQRQDVVLNAGMQILNAQRRASFSLSGIKGRTLVNMLGRMGKLDSVTNLGEFQADLAIETTDKVQGTGSLKVTIETGNPNGAGFIGQVNFLSGKYYIIAADIKNISAANGCAITLSGGGTSSGYITDKTKWTTAFVRYTSAVDIKINLDFAVWGAGGESGLFDAARVYEISKAAYDEIPSMTREQVAAKYPYVDSIQPVRNPYAIRYGENLASGYPTAIAHRSGGEQFSIPTIQGAYEVKFTGEALSRDVDKGVYFDAPVIPGHSYTAAVDTLADNAFIRFEYFKDSSSISNSKWVKTPDFFSSNGPCTATIPSGCSVLRVYITNQTEVYWNNGTLVNNSLVGGSYRFKNWRVFLGTKDLGFKPREDSMLALQMDLHADPLTGANADEVFEKDGQYFKLAKWKRVSLDTVSGWSNDGVFGTTRRVALRDTYNPTLDGHELFTRTIATKYDGKILGGDSTNPQTSDYVLRNPSNRILYITLDSAEAGWGDQSRVAEFTGNGSAVKFTLPAVPAGFQLISTSVTARVDSTPVSVVSVSGLDVTVATAPASGKIIVVSYKIAYMPTTDEIKAYFMGWVMRQDGTVDQPYTSGIKFWRQKLDNSNPTNILPTTPSPNWTPYQLVYQLATPTVEPIVSEGMLTFNEGDNQIEVGSGLVVRESAVFAAQTSTSEYSYNAVVPGAGQAKYKVRDFLNVYESGRPISGYTKTLRATHNGAAIALPRGLFNDSAAYSVTYLMLDTSPIVPFSGSYAANEKAMLQELTDAVQQNTTAVSVLMNKKADKDSPGWITPTLLNGWVPYSDGANYYGYPAAQYMKDSQGFVYLRGLVKKGPVGSVLFYLPEGYRPKETYTFATICFPSGASETIARIRVSPDGSVTYVIGPALTGDASWISLNLPQFTLD